MPESQLNLDSVLEARERLQGHLRLTPVAESTRLGEIAGMQVVLKHEYLQATGAFKERGARNALLRLDRAQQLRGVIAASAGNHALGLARHGAALGVPVTVVMPRSAPAVKVQRCAALGARILLEGANFDEAAAAARRLAKRDGLHLVHPFDDLDVASGQGTLALELFAQIQNVDTLVIPLGGGGLLAGVLAVAKSLHPGVRVVGVEPIHAPSFTTARAAGAPVRAPVHRTLADGLAVAEVGKQTFEFTRALVDDVVTVSEDEIADALWHLYRAERVVAEGAGVAGLAAVLAGRISGMDTKRVACPITGANIDPAVHARALARAESRHAEAA